MCCLEDSPMFQNIGNFSCNNVDDLKAALRRQIQLIREISPL